MTEQANDRDILRIDVCEDGSIFIVAMFPERFLEALRKGEGRGFEHQIPPDQARSVAMMLARETGALGLWWSSAKATIRSQAEKIRKLKREVTYARECSEKRNRQLDALGMVWCNGGCSGGMARCGPLEVGPAPTESAPPHSRSITGKHIAWLLHNAARGLDWYINREFRRARYDDAAVWRAHNEVRQHLPPVYQWIVPLADGEKKP